MKNKKNNIAIFSPSQNPYSETFIQAHKLYLKDRVFYYYGPRNNIMLEGTRNISTKFERIKLKFIRRLLNKPWAYLWTTPIKKSIKKNKIDHILVEYGTHAYHLLPLLSLVQIPYTVHFHGYDASVKHIIKSCNNYKEVFALAHKVIAVSKKMEAMLLSIGCPKEKLVYNVYGPQPEYHDISPSFVKKQFIAIGRFTDKKAPYYTILAFSKVVSKHKDAHLLMVGDGILLNSCKNLVKYLGLDNNIKFLGVITPEDYRNLLSESLAFVQHSITAENGDMEGTPLAVLEASAAGLPVISTNHAGIPDVIVHEETGLLCEEHDVDKMAEHMLQILNNKEKAIQLGNNGNKRIEQYFSLESHTAVLQNLINNV